MKFNEETNTLSLEKKDCVLCLYGAGEQGEYTGDRVCDVCNGAGNGVRGGRGKCKGCYGRGTKPDFENPIVCPRCNGNFKDAQWEDFCDSAPSAVVTSIPMKVVRLDRDNTWNENFMGIGTLFSVTDYGTMSERDDDAALDHAAEHLAKDRTQATKIAKYERGDHEAVVCDLLAVCITRTGWSLRPFWNE